MGSGPQQQPIDFYYFGGSEMKRPVEVLNATCKQTFKAAIKCGQSLKFPYVLKMYIFFFFWPGKVAEVADVYFFIIFNVADVLLRFQILHFQT